MPFPCCVVQTELQKYAPLKERTEGELSTMKKMLTSLDFSSYQRR